MQKGTTTREDFSQILHMFFFLLTLEGILLQIKQQIITHGKKEIYLLKLY